MDGDNQHPLVEIGRMLELAQKGSHIVVALRDGKEQASFFKKITSRIFYKIWNWLSGMTIETGSSDFRLITRDVLYFVNKHEEQFLFPSRSYLKYGFSERLHILSSSPTKICKPKFTLARMFQLSVSGIVWGSVKPQTCICFKFIFSIISCLFWGVFFVCVFRFLREYYTRLDIINGYYLLDWGAAISVDWYTRRIYFCYSS